MLLALVTRNLDLLAQAHPIPSVSAFLHLRLIPEASGLFHTLAVHLHPHLYYSFRRTNPLVPHHRPSRSATTGANFHLAICSPYSPGVRNQCQSVNRQKRALMWTTLQNRRRLLMTGGILTRTTTHRGGVSPLGGYPDVQMRTLIRSRISALRCGSILCILTLSTLMRRYSRRLVLLE